MHPDPSNTKRVYLLNGDNKDATHGLTYSVAKGGSGEYSTMLMYLLQR